MVLEHQVRRRSILVSSLGGAALAAVLLAGCARDREQVQAAENAAESLTRGMRVIVSGRLRPSRR